MVVAVAFPAKLSRRMLCKKADAIGYKALPMAPPDPAVVAEENDEEFESLGDDLMDPPETCLEIILSMRFVETGVFQGISALVICGNTIAIFLEANDPAMKQSLAMPDLCALWFYIFELLFRICYFRRRFVCGPARTVSWNLLDIAVVLAGAFDQWVIPHLVVHHRGPLRTFMQMLRLMRLFRMLKIVRIFLETDLSWTETPGFQSFIGMVIGFNALLMGFETDIDWAGWFFIEQVLLIIYVFELMVNFKYFGTSLLSLRNPDFGWNMLDFVIVASSVLDSWLVPLVNLVLDALNSDDESVARHKKKGMNLSQVMMLMRMLRLMRILRLVKLVKTFRPLYILVTGVAAAVQGVAWVLVLTVVTLYALGIMATRLIGHGLIFNGASGLHPEADSIKVFGTVTQSMFTLFRLMSGASSNDEAMAIDDLMQAVPSVKFGFVFFTVTSSWTLLSILTAVVSDNMISTTASQEEELRIASAEEDRREHMTDLQDLFGTIDTSNSGCIDLAEIETFLKDQANALECAKRCRVPVRNVVEIFKTLAVGDRAVPMDEFLDCMCDVTKPVTEQSMMKLTAVINESQRNPTGEILEAVGKLARNQSFLCKQQQAWRGDVESRLSSFGRKTGDRMQRLESKIQGLQGALRHRHVDGR